MKINCLIITGVLLIVLVLGRIIWLRIKEKYKLLGNLGRTRIRFSKFRSVDPDDYYTDDDEPISLKYRGHRYRKRVRN